MCVSAGNGVLVLFFPIRVTIVTQYAINYGKNTPFKVNEETQGPFRTRKNPRKPHNNCHSSTISDVGMLARNGPSLLMYS